MYQDLLLNNILLHMYYAIIYNNILLHMYYAIIYTKKQGMLADYFLSIDGLIDWLMLSI
jgi:hypothetical protein